MTKQEFALISIETEPEVTFEELCEAFDLTPHFIEELIEYGAIEPSGFSRNNWRFNGYQLRRIHQIKRLHEELELNLQGALVAADLMEQIENLRFQVELLEKHLMTAHLKF